MDHEPWDLVDAWHLVDPQPSLQKWTELMWGWIRLEINIFQEFTFVFCGFSVLHEFRNTLLIIWYREWKRGNLAQNSGLGV